MNFAKVELIGQSQSRVDFCSCAQRGWYAGSIHIMCAEPSLRVRPPTPISRSVPT